jgi:hypothetical protein
MLEVADKVIEGVKAIREIAQKLHDADLQNQIADLLNNSANLKLELAEQKAELLNLRTENEDLKRGRDLRQRLIRKDSVLQLIAPDPFYGDGPFCPICFENTSKLMQVFANPNTRTWVCPNCAKEVGFVRP